MLRSARIAIPLTILLLAACESPIAASCASSHLLNTSSEYLVSNPNWGGAGGTGTCYFGYGCYEDDPTGGPQSPPIGDRFVGWFWSLGTGDPAVGAGDDNGAFHTRRWTKQVRRWFPDHYY